MTEPLLRRLAARGERLTVGALPWVAPVYRAMPQVAEVIDFPFQHGGLQLKARRAIARQIEGPFQHRLRAAQFAEERAAAVAGGHPKRVGYLGEARVGLLTHRLKNPKNKPPMVAFYSALSGESGLEADRPCSSCPRPRWMRP
jgi:heptosyltransferase-2